MSKKVIQIGVTTTTDYLSGFQYKKKTASEPVELQFFPHAEGYVNVSKSDLKEVSAAFNYVFNYTDHLGNIRLSYSQDPSTNVLKVIEENHYYPFGLKHTGYNSDQMMYVKEEYIVKIKPKPLLFKTSYNYKFQGQERQDELGLNWDSFKWRNYDYTIGRFMSIDPLTEEYNTWSPYTFSGNRVIDARELEGLEPYILFGSENNALKNFGQQYNGKSIKQGAEYGTNVYKTTASDGNTYYYYEEPNKGNEASVRLPSTLFDEGERVSTIHTHGEYLEKYDNNNFSPTDKENAEKRGVDNNVVTPDGSLKNYDVKTNKETVISTSMPSDPKDPDRKNTVAPNENPAPVKTTPIVPKKVEVKTTGEIEYHHGRVM